MDFEDPPSLRAVVRRSLGAAVALATVAALGLFLASGRVEGKLVALILALWGAWSFFDAIIGSVIEPLGRFLGSALTGATLPGDSRISIDEETAMLERLLAADPPPPSHRAALAGIRLAEIYRTHQRDAAKAEALLGRLATQYPDAPELRYARPG